MNTYLIRTQTAMKPYNGAKYWIDNNSIADIRIKADSLTEALITYKWVVEDRSLITISKTALNNKEPVYIDTEQGSKQVGYCITACHIFERDDGSFARQYIDLWLNICILKDVDFSQAN